LISHIDHIVYNFSDSLRDKIISQFCRAGFMKHTRQVVHINGCLSIFFKLSGGYLEFCFDDSTKVQNQLSLHHSVWLSSTNLMADFQALSSEWRTAITVTESAPAGEDTPAWLIANLPTPCCIGTSISIIQYLRGSGTEFASLISDNGLYGINGVSHFCGNPERQRKFWSNGLGELVDRSNRQRDQIWIGHQWLEFLQQGSYPYTGPVDLRGIDILAHLATTKLERTILMLHEADFILDNVPGLGLVAQSRIAPSICLVLDDVSTPSIHQAQLLERLR